MPQTRSSVEAMFPNLAVDLSTYEQLLLSLGATYRLGQDAASGDAGSARGNLTLVGSNPAAAKKPPSPADAGTLSSGGGRAR